jgi:hypothetical protein
MTAARMNSVLWRHSFENDTVVTEIPVFDSEYRESIEPFILCARATTHTSQTIVTLRAAGGRRGTG